MSWMRARYSCTPAAWERLRSARPFQFALGSRIPSERMSLRPTAAIVPLETAAFDALVVEVVLVVLVVVGVRLVVVVVVGRLLEVVVLVAVVVLWLLVVVVAVVVVVLVRLVVVLVLVAALVVLVVVLVARAEAGVPSANKATVRATRRRGVLRVVAPLKPWPGRPMTREMARITAHAICVDTEPCFLASLAGEAASTDAKRSYGRWQEQEFSRAVLR